MRVVEFALVNLRKTFFIIPNLFTLASLFCGFFAIVSVAHAQLDMGHLYQAAIAIGFGFFFDLADGRVARLTKTQSSLGLQLDSLADLVTFGVAPALLMYRWGLDKLETHHAGILVAFLFVAAGALRLARFNVLALKEAAEKEKEPAGASKPGKYILGLPVPAAAAVLVGLVVLNHQVGGSFVDVGQAALAMVVVVLSYLMVSRVRFRSFKDLRPSRRTITVAAGIAGGAVVAVFFKRVPSAFVFVCLMAAYVALGLLEEVVFYQRRRAERLAQAAKEVAPADGGARSDEEVLAELGAYDGDESDEPPLGDHPPPVLKAERRP